MDENLKNKNCISNLKICLLSHKSREQPRREIPRSTTDSRPRPPSAPPWSLPPSIGGRRGRGAKKPPFLPSVGRREEWRSLPSSSPPVVAKDGERRSLFSSFRPVVARDEEQRCSMGPWCGIRGWSCRRSCACSASTTCRWASPWRSSSAPASRDSPSSTSSTSPRSPRAPPQVGAPSHHSSSPPSLGTPQLPNPTLIHLVRSKLEWILLEVVKTRNMPVARVRAVSYRFRVQELLLSMES